ncbi:hypothetical protein PRUPE_4G162200 [Prunus persica]|uniref:Uncharacterized protein n=1 Tax=Prunus persica TaxID=3760 RepID=A0A251PLE7_PRUPE|nr:hypothetical protein PRUPE_4G162200 [Prunus persica]
MLCFLEIEGATVGFYCEHSKRQSFYISYSVCIYYLNPYICSTLQNDIEWYKNNSKGIFLSLIIHIQNSLACRWSRELSSC